MGRSLLSQASTRPDMPLGSFLRGRSLFNHSRVNNLVTPLLPSQAVLLANRARKRSSLGLGRQSIGVNGVRQGALSRNDGLNPSRVGRYADDYDIKGLKAGQRVTVTLASKAFDAYLQLINLHTGKVMLYGDDTSTHQRNARLVFTATSAGRYLLRVTSYSRGETGRYTLKTKMTRSQPGRFDFYTGYGLVNAAAAVARALGQVALAPGPTKGGSKGGDRWTLEMLQVPEVWAQGYTGQGVVVAVIDNGVDYRHPNLAPALWRNPREIPHNGIDDDNNGFIDDTQGWDFVRDDNDPTSDPFSGDRLREGHGTHVAGIVAAAPDEGGLAGVAYGAKIMPIRVYAHDTATDDPQLDVQVAAGIRYAVRNGAQVINLSLGNYPGDPAMRLTYQAMHEAEQHGVLVIVAAGNSRQNYGAIAPGEPALFTLNGVGLSVGSINRNRKLSPSSNPAGSTPSAFLVAPGVDIVSTVPGGGYTWLSGTSMAAPHVAGVVALMLSANPTLTPAQIRAALTETSNRQSLIVV